MMHEKREIEAREREQQLTRKNRADADPLLMESWLNDALTSADEADANAVDPDRPPVELLQQGAAGLRGLQNFGLTRDDLKKRGLSSKSIERVYRSMYVYTIGFHDILKDVFSHCEDKAELIASVWAGYHSISENTLKSTFKSEFLEMLGEQRETDVYLLKTRDDLAAKARECAEKTEALNDLTEKHGALVRERNQLKIKHRQLSTIVEQERASRDHARQKYFSEVEHRTAMAEEVAETRESCEKMRLEHEASTKAAKKATDQCVRADTARRHAMESTRKYLEELKIARERDTRMTNEVDSLRGRLTDLSSELERTTSQFSEESRLKILLQADLANKREEARELAEKVRTLEDELQEMREESRDAATRESSLTTERDLLQSRLANTSEELETTQATLMRERAGYSKMTAEWGQMTEKVEDLTIREGAAVKRALALSADLETARSALREERQAHASSSSSLNDARTAHASLGVALATTLKSLSDERLARRSLRNRIRETGDAQMLLEEARAKERTLVKELQTTREALDTTSEELGRRNAECAALETRLGETTARLRKTEEELQAAKERLESHARDLQSSEAEIDKARAEAARLTDDLQKLEAENVETVNELKEVRRLKHEASVRVDNLASDLAEARNRGDQAASGLEEAVKKLSAMTERVRLLETENLDVARRAGDVGEEVTELRLELDLQRNQRERAEETCREAEDKTNRLAESLAEAEHREESLQQELDTAHRDLDAAKLGIHDAEQRLVAELRALETQLLDEREAHATKTSLLENSESELASAQAEISAMSAARDQMVEESQQMERMLKEAQTVRAFLQGEIASYKTRCEQFKAAKAEAEVKLDLLREQSERAAADANVKFAVANETLKARVKDLEEDLEAERAARQADVDVVRLEGMEQAKEWRDSLKAEIGTLTIQLERAESQLGETSAALEKTQGDAAMAAKVAAVKIVDLENKLKNAEELLAATALSGDEEKQHKHALGAAVSKLQEEAVELNAKIASLEETNGALERQLSALKMAKDSDAADAAAAAAQAADAAAQAADAAAHAATVQAAQAADAKKHAIKSTVTMRWTRGVVRAPGDLVVIRQKELFDKGNRYAPPMDFTPRVLRTIVMQILCEKIAADAEEEAAAAKGSGAGAGSGSLSHAAQTLEEFTYDFFLHRFGLRAAAEHHLHCLVEAVERDFSKDPRVQVFGRMIGVANPLPLEACRCLLAFLSQLFKNIGGLTAADFSGDKHDVSVHFVQEAAEVACPELVRTLAEEVKARAAEASKNGGGGGDALDLDIAMSLMIRHWEKASEELTRDLESSFMQADVNGDGLMSYDEFRDLVRAAAAAQASGNPGQEVKEISARQLKAMFREALSKSSPHGSTITKEAFASTAREHDLCGVVVGGGGSGTSGGDKAGGLVPLSGSLTFDEWGVLEGSWEKMRGVMEQVAEMLAELPSADGELSNLRGMISDLEGILTDKAAPIVSGWALYRRVLMTHATHRHRLEVSEMESGK